MAIPVMSGFLGNVGFGAIYSKISPKFSLLSQIPLTAQKKSFALSTIAQGIFTHHSSSHETRKFFVKKSLCTYLLISSLTYFFHREALKANAMSSLVLGTAQLAIGKLALKFSKTSHLSEGMVQQVLNWRNEEIDSKIQTQKFQISDRVKSCNIDTLCGFKKEFLEVSWNRLRALVGSLNLKEETKSFFTNGIEACVREKNIYGFYHRFQFQLIKGYTYALLLSISSWSTDDENKRSIAMRYHETCVDEDSCMYHKIGLLQQLIIEVNKGKKGLLPAERAAIIWAQGLEACVTESVTKLCKKEDDVANIQRETLFRVYKELKTQGRVLYIPEIAQKGLESIERDSLGGESEYFSERICQAAVERSLKNLDLLKVWIKGSGIPDFDQEISLFIDDQIESNKSTAIKEFMSERGGEEEKDSCTVAVTSEQMRLVYFLETDIISNCV